MFFLCNISTIHLQVVIAIVCGTDCWEEEDSQDVNKAGFELLGRSWRLFSTHLCGNKKKNLTHTQAAFWWVISKCTQAELCLPEYSTGHLEVVQTKQTNVWHRSSTMVLKRWVKAQEIQFVQIKATKKIIRNSECDPEEKQKSNLSFESSSCSVAYNVISVFRCIFPLIMQHTLRTVAPVLMLIWTQLNTNATTVWLTVNFTQCNIPRLCVFFPSFL